MENPIFVIQKHSSSTLHYDFRLQIGDVLKSWVIPKGPSLNPKDKRLAILTEDHALSFADFEDKIPEGQYGAGKMIVWDKGTYENITTKDGNHVPIQEAFEYGEIIISLQGEKLQGKFVLVLMKKQKEPKNWLLIKQDDEYSSSIDPTVEFPNSVLSKKSIEEN